LVAAQAAAAAVAPVPKERSRRGFSEFALLKVDLEIRKGLDWLRT
jgi:hypothetical protein